MWRSVVKCGILLGSVEYCDVVGCSGVWCGVVWCSIEECVVV